MKKLIIISVLAGAAFFSSGCGNSDDAALPATDQKATDAMAAEMENQAGEMQDATAGEKTAK